jgi:hypothetical protein
MKDDLPAADVFLLAASVMVTGYGAVREALMIAFLLVPKPATLRCIP